MGQTTDDLIARMEPGDVAARNALLARLSERLKGRVRERLRKRFQFRNEDTTSVYHQFVICLCEGLEKEQVKDYEHLMARVGENLKWHLGNLGRERAGQPAHAVGHDPNEIDPMDRFPVKAAGPSARVELAEARALARALVDRLPAGQREVIRLRFWDSQKLKDIAVALGIHYNTAKNRLKRALRRLSGMLRKGEAT